MMLLRFNEDGNDDDDDGDDNEDGDDDEDAKVMNY